MKPHHLSSPLFTAEQIKSRVASLATDIAVNETREITLIGLLHGSFILMADLARELADWQDQQLRFDFMTLQSYVSDTQSSGQVRVKGTPCCCVRDRDVWIIDDILDTGHTLSFAQQYLLQAGARSVRSCVLLNKPQRRVANIEADLVGFTISDQFVVGYGLDYDGRYRELPHICEVVFE